MKTSTAILQSCSGYLVVSYSLEVLSEDELRINLVRVVPAQWEGSLVLGKPVTPTRDEKVSILKALAAMEFGNVEQSAEVPRG